MRLAPIVALLLLGAGAASAAPPNIREVFVTDVTTRAASVVLTVSEPCDGVLEVYRDAAGTDPVLGVVSEASGGSRGVMKLRVSGLASNRSYHLRARLTSRATGELAVHGPLALTTEAVVQRGPAPWSNHLVLERFFEEDGVTPAAGAAVLVQLAGSSTPLSAFVGEGAPAPGAALDLNNLFAASNHGSMQHAGGEDVVVTLVRGPGDRETRGYRLPAASRPGEVLRLLPLSQDVPLAAEWNLIAFQLEPSDPSVPAVFAGIAADVLEVWQQDGLAWRRWVPAEGVEQIGALHAKVGYLVRMARPATLTVTGARHLDPVPVASGFSFRGASGLADEPVAAAVLPLEGSLRAIWGFDPATQRWTAYSPNIPAGLNDLGVLRPGRGYYLELDEARLW